MNRTKWIAFTVLILLSVCLYAAALAEFGYTPLPKDDTLYLFWEPVTGDKPAPPQVEVNGGSVTVTGLSAWGYPEEALKKYRAGSEAEDKIRLNGKPKDIEFFAKSKEPVSRYALSFRESPDYAGQYSVTLELTYNNGDMLKYSPETGKVWMMYGGMTAWYDAGGTLLYAEYRKEDKKSSLYYRYERQKTELPVFRVTYASYKDKKSTEEWDIYHPEDCTANPKHISPDKLPFTVAGQEKADRILAERAESGLKWLEIPAENAAYSVLNCPALPQYSYEKDEKIITCTLSGVKEWLFPDEDMRIWTYDPATDKWTPSDELLQDQVVFVYPVILDDSYYIWKASASPSPEWKLTVYCRSDDYGHYPLTVSIDSRKHNFYYELWDAGIPEGLTPYVYFSDIRLTYYPDGRLFEYTITRDNMRYAYRYSSSSGHLILNSIRNYGENSYSYWRGLNDVWYTYDSSRKQTQCYRPQEADDCPPLPIR